MSQRGGWMAQCGTKDKHDTEVGTQMSQGGGQMTQCRANMTQRWAHMPQGGDREGIADLTVCGKQET